MKKTVNVKNLSRHRMKKIADEFLATGNKTQTAKKILGTKRNDVAKDQTTTILNRDYIKNYIESKALRAAERIDILAETSDNAQVQLAANKDILDRAGFKPQETQVNINVPMYLPPEVMEKYQLQSKRYKAEEEENSKPIQYFINEEGEAKQKE